MYRPQVAILVNIIVHRRMNKPILNECYSIGHSL